jgi:hypothetical protein
MPHSGTQQRHFYVPEVMIYDRKVLSSLHCTFTIVNHALARIINYASRSVIYDHAMVTIQATVTMIINYDHSTFLEQVIALKRP